ncbi:MAG: hypothetical protein ABS894_00875 [Aerococcus urinaeequi]
MIHYHVTICIKKDDSKTIAEWARETQFFDFEEDLYGALAFMKIAAEKSTQLIDIELTMSYTGGE